MRCTCATRILSLFPACALSLSSLLQKSISTAAPRLPATKLICSNLNVYSGAAALSASMMLLCCSLALSSFVPRKSSFLSDKGLNSMMYSVQWYLWITMPSGQPLILKNKIMKRCWVEIMAFFFVFFHRNCFLKFCCLFRQRLSTAYLLKTHFPATTCWYYSLYQMWQPWAYSLVFVQLIC